MSLQPPTPAAEPAGWQPRGTPPSNGSSPPTGSLPVPGPVSATAPVPATADRLPRPPRRRSAGLAALAVLLVAGGAAVAGLLALRIDDRVDMLVARTDIAAGQQITADQLAVAPVAAQGVDLIPASRRSEVIGRYAAVPIPARRLIDVRMVTAQAALRAGSVAVGVVLAPGQAPAGGLLAGDRVTVYGTDDAGRVISRDAVVSSVRAPQSGAFGATGNQTVATLIVSEADAAKVAAASAAGRLALGLTRRGAPVSGQDG
jgi:Flp pilus assembly protein CpaB